MISFPNCKINLGLNIISKREDGFHNLETVFYPLHLCDALEIIPSQNAITTIAVTGINAGNDEDNLCLKAYRLLKKDYSEIPEIKIYLHKQIPIGAGLGGGSADAAFIIRMICKNFNLNISEAKIFEYALQLGSDCPFFLYNLPCFATGRGEAFEPVNVTLKDYKILLIHPDIHISTAEAFKNITPCVPQKKIKEIVLQPIHTWKDELTNDFEKYVFEKYIAVKKIKQDLYDAGAMYASMSGSGSSLFGIFQKDFPINYNTSVFHKIINAT